MKLTHMRRWIYPLGIGLLALACRAMWATQPRTVRWDEPDYLILARNLLRGEGYHIFGSPDTVWPPGAPGLAAASLAAGVPAEYALVAWHIIAGVAACLLVYALAREVTGDNRVAALAGFLAAVSPAVATWPLYWGSLTGVPFLAALLAGWWASWRMLRGGGWRTAAAAGLAFGVACLIRTEGLFWWAMMLALLAALAIRQRRRWPAVAVLALSFALVIAPYLGYLYQHTGRFMLSGKTGIVTLLTPHVIEQGGAGQDFTARLDSTGTEILWLSPEQFEVSWLETVRADPQAFLRRARQNLSLTAENLLDPLLGIFLLGLAVLGLLGGAWDRRRLIEEGFWLAILVPLGVLYISKVETRYLLPALPVAWVWAARGAWRLVDWVKLTLDPACTRRAIRPVAIVLISTALLASGLAGQIAASRTGQAGLIPSHEAAGRWLADNSEPGAAIMSRNSEIALYADRPLIAFPSATWEQVLAYGRARSAQYLVTDDWELTRLRPQLAFLLEPDGAPQELEYLTSFRDDLRITLIYRIVE